MCPERQGCLGIGLALARQLVERQGGRIEVESEGVGRGAAFSIWLPRFEYPAIVPLRELPSAAEGAWQGVRVLIADDAMESAETFGRLLEMDGANATETGRLVLACSPRPHHMLAQKFTRTDRSQATRIR